VNKCELTSAHSSVARTINRLMPNLGYVGSILSKLVSDGSQVKISPVCILRKQPLPRQLNVGNA
jgi:hypothetical protein